MTHQIRVSLSLGLLGLLYIASMKFRVLSIIPLSLVLVGSVWFYRGAVARMGGLLGAISVLLVFGEPLTYVRLLAVSVLLLIAIDWHWQLHLSWVVVVAGLITIITLTNIVFGSLFHALTLLTISASVVLLANTARSFVNES